MKWILILAGLSIGALSIWWWMRRAKSIPHWNYDVGHGQGCDCLYCDIERGRLDAKSRE